jgi:hypothetical protein
MTNIRTNCPRCGEVETEASLVSLRVQATTGEGTYSFVCPVCEERVRKPADRKLVELLRSVGAETSLADPHPSASWRPELPPLTLDDLIDLHFLLQEEDWFVELLAGAD